VGGDLYVAPEHRGRGVARALLGAAEVRCADLGCSPVSVVVTDDGQARYGLRAFYARHGFVAQDRVFLNRGLKATS
jgi:GNAT superfamily N-acetyltransferase